MNPWWSRNDRNAAATTERTRKMARRSGFRRSRGRLSNRVSMSAPTLSAIGRGSGAAAGLKTSSAVAVSSHPFRTWGFGSMRPRTATTLSRTIFDARLKRSGSDFFLIVAWNVPSRCRTIRKAMPPRLRTSSTQPASEASLLWSAGGILEAPAHPRLLGHVVRQVGELVLRPQLAAVLSHHRADDIFRGLEDQLLCELVVAFVRDAHSELVPDERGVLRVIEHVPLQDLAIRDCDVAAGEAVPVQQTAELTERRVHRGDFDDVPFRLVHLDPVAEFVEAHRHDDDPANDVEERLLQNVDQRRGD